ncbi:GH32 C-terminal domain-containing protein [Salegentibacter mishustinae]|uniref:GH32 C-terminal domain-containing protein n=1 Tax=Salegentibacter mishustinae TaxID=270918 RepID=UPI002490443C|nr:GH32 C-terminal domain-containing protein [Salegentibacter mishustinae]
MKKIIFLKLLLAVSLLTSCYDDDVVFVNETDNLRINKLFEFKFDETSGNTTEESETGNTFEIQGKAVSRMDGVSESAIFFDGLTNEIDGEIDTNLLPEDEVTISLWASPRSYPVGTAAMLAMTSEGSSTGIMVGLNKFGQIVVQYFIDGSFSQTVTNEIIPRNQWNHILVGISPATQSISIYMDQELLTSANIPSGSITWPSGSTPISIGKNTMGEMMGIFDIDYYSGALDEIQIYSGNSTPAVAEFISSQYGSPAEPDYNLDLDYSGDNNRPLYHPIPEFGWANESYGLVGLDGTYHMFYQKNEVFLGIANQNWGHFTSSDLVDWEEQDAVLWPSTGWDNFGIWSGDAIILEDGTPAVVYTGVDGIKAGIGTAFSNDNYQTLDKFDGNPVIPAAPPEVDLDFRDPYVIYKDGLYHMIVGSGISSIGGNVVYYTSEDFENWEYNGILLQGQSNQGEGSFWEMPVLHEFEDGRFILLVQKTPDATPAITFYWTGSFENGVFTPDFEDPKYLEVVNGFLSPAVAVDDQGRTTAIGIIPDEVAPEFQQEQGYANLFSLAQVWTLDEDGTILIEPHPNLENYRGEETSFGTVDINPGSTDNIDFTGRHFEMETTINTGTADRFGFVLGQSETSGEEYRVYYDFGVQEWVVDASDSSTSDLVRRDVRRGEFNISRGDTVDLRIFVDGSVLEVFINGESHFTGRFFPQSNDANGVDLFTEGGSASAEVTIYEIENN